MGILRVFGIGADRILREGTSVAGTVTKVRKSILYVIKKPVRLYNNESNTRYSHYVFFSYTVNDKEYNGKLFVNPYTRCPTTGERIEVFYEPGKPENYACYSFGPATLPIGW